MEISFTKMAKVKKMNFLLIPAWSDFSISITNVENLSLMSSINH